MNLKKKIKEKILDMLIIKLVKKTTNNIGNIEIYDNKIIVHVDNMKLKNNFKQNMHYWWGLKKGNINDEYLYNLLSKPIYYIVENCEFNSIKFNTGENTTIIFKKCIFNHSMFVRYGYNIIFDNCKFNDLGYGYCWTHGFFMDITSKKLKFINTNLVNYNKLYTKIQGENEYKFCFNFNTNTLKLENSIISSSDFIKIKSNEICLINSNLYCKRYYMDCDSVLICNSYIYATDEVLTKTKSNIDIPCTNDSIIKNDEVDEKNITPIYFKNNLKNINQVAHYRKLKTIK